MLRKLSIVFVLLVACLASLWADGLREVGTGATDEEARNDAISRITSFVASSVSLDMTSSVNDDGLESESGSSISQDLMKAPQDYLIGLKQGASFVSDGVHYVTMYLDDSSLADYIYKLDYIAGQVDVIWRSNSRFSKPLEVSDETYERLVTLLYDYNQYRNVALLLDEDVDESVKDLPVSLGEVEAMWDSRLASIGSDLEDELSFYGQLERIGGLNDEDRQKVTLLEQELESLRNAYGARYETLSGTVEKRIEELEAKMGQEDAQASMDVDDLLAEIDMRLEAVDELRTLRDEEIASMQARLESETTAYRDRYLSLPYGSIDYDEDGKLKESSVTTRQKKIQDEVDSMTDAYAYEAASALASWNSRIAGVLSSLIKLVRDNSGTRFNIDSATGYHIYFIIDGFDGTSASYTGKTSLSLDGGRTEFEFALPYRKLTGDAVPPADSIEYITEFSPVAGQLLDLLRGQDSPMEVEMSVSFEALDDGLNYALTVEKVTFILNGQPVDWFYTRTVVANSTLFKLDELESFFLPSDEDAMALVEEVDSYGRYADNGVDAVRSTLREDWGVDEGPVYGESRMTTNEVSPESLKPENPISTTRYELYGEGDNSFSLSLSLAHGFGRNWENGGTAALGIQFIPDKAYLDGYDFAVGFTLYADLGLMATQPDVLGNPLLLSGFCIPGIDFSLLWLLEKANVVLRVGVSLSLGLTFPQSDVFFVNRGRIGLLFHVGEKTMEAGILVNYLYDLPEEYHEKMTCVGLYTAYNF